MKILQVLDIVIASNHAKFELCQAFSFATAIFVSRKYPSSRLMLLNKCYLKKWKIKFNHIKPFACYSLIFTWLILKEFSSLNQVVFLIINKMWRKEGNFFFKSAKGNNSINYISFIFLILFQLKRNLLTIYCIWRADSFTH